jgi:hypothetical protein
MSVKYKEILVKMPALIPPQKEKGDLTAALSELCSLLQALTFSFG